MENLREILKLYFKNEEFVIRNLYLETGIEVYGNYYGIVGVSEEEFINLSKQHAENLIENDIIIINNVIIIKVENHRQEVMNSVNFNKKIISQIIAKLKNIEFTEEYYNEFEGNIEKALLESLKAIRVASFKEKQKILENNIEHIKNDIQRTKESLDSYIKILINYQVTSYKEVIKTTDDKFDSEIKLIKNHKKVKSIGVEGIRLAVKTHHLYITEPTSNRRFSLGEMIIKIPLTVDKSVYIQNLTTRRDGYWDEAHHPHVAYDEEPCLGNVDSGVASYLMEENYYGVFLLLLNYLECVDITDCAGAYVRAWDEVNEDNEIINEGTGKLTWNGEYSEDDNEEDEDGEYYEDNFYCEMCDCTIPSEDHYNCDACNIILCDDCAQHGDDGTYCRGCFNEITERRRMEAVAEEPDIF